MRLVLNNRAQERAPCCTSTAYHTHRTLLLNKAGSTGLCHSDLWHTIFLLLTSTELAAQRSVTTCKFARRHGLPHTLSLAGAAPSPGLQAGGCSLFSSRSMMMRMTSLVPSRMACTRRSRRMRSKG